MATKPTFEKEFLKFQLNIDVWIKSTKERIKLLPEAERLSKISYDEWLEIHKDKLTNNNFKEKLNERKYSSMSKDSK